MSFHESHETEIRNGAWAGGLMVPYMECTQCGLIDLDSRAREPCKPRDGDS